MREALLIIDVQNDYFPGGANELAHPYEAEKRIQELIADSRANGRPIVYIQHFNPPDDYFFLEGTKGAEISERIRPEKGDKIIVKRFPNSFLETDLDAYLKRLQIDTLIVCGMMTHMCVDTTVRAAMDYGYQVKLVAVRGRGQRNKERITCDSVFQCDRKQQIRCGTDCGGNGGYRCID